MDRKLKKLFNKLDKLCENRKHDDFELFDNVFQCKKCFRVKGVFND